MIACLHLGIRMCRSHQLDMLRRVDVFQESSPCHGFWSADDALGRHRKTVRLNIHIMGAAYQEHSREPPRREEPEWDSDRSVIFRETDNPNGIFTSAPKEAFKLGYFDVMCLVLNRMIGKF